MVTNLTLAVLSCLALAACSPEKAENSSALPIGEGFDFYVLALSWSPGYCDSEGARADKTQCGPGRSYEFVVHGLWPQFEKGYPQNCDSQYGERLDNDVAEPMLDIMPSMGLIRHQWRKHGRCSGLSPTDYFAVTRAAYETINTPPSFNGLQETMTVSPDSVEKLFIAANPKLSTNGMGVTCKRNYLRDVRICMTSDLTSFRPCPEVDRNYCKSGPMAVPPVR